MPDEPTARALLEKDIERLIDLGGQIDIARLALDNLQETYDGLWEEMWKLADSVIERADKSTIKSIFARLQNYQANNADVLSKIDEYTETPPDAR